MTLTEKLADAEAKYHQLLTGQSARVVVDQNGERVEFTAISASRLAAYIMDLKRQIGVSTHGPLVPYF
ncbi:gpW family head-tail joining protein [uncultured Halomonas sp.]|uniref:gpW family head-tail joining protein n=1 Tax=uncultured Halomonas sp. TaxID=173971 RepID=UPI0026203346|nr:gpW family head-tail joining protein [uncultured Halomonas sp.]